ncbi:MAG TPA: VPLPA-CTERM sorting domain-containing protein [Sedimenticola sp.]|nr:VPLPA-CTERM sorting domain-containing protein [Sedimenticola sp.]
MGYGAMSVTKKKNRGFTKAALTSAILCATTWSGGAAAASAGFDGKDITSSFVYGTIPLDTVTVTASDAVNPDVDDLYSISGDRIWDVDYAGNTITMTYDSINDGHEYMYGSSEHFGFHFEDTANNLPDILGITVDTTFAPHMFMPGLVSFDANNIWVDLAGSMCHAMAMGSMPSCMNGASPTGWNNQIGLSVDFGGHHAPPVPLPAAAWLMLSGMGVLGFMRRRRTA